MMNCPECGAGDVVIETRSLPYSYQGETTSIDQVTGLFCNDCDEVVLSPDQAARVSEAMLAFNRAVNAKLVAPGFIARVRKKLKLDQQEAAELFGGGVNAFSRYENGKTRPPLALIKLLRVLDQHPDLLNEIRGEPTSVTV